MVVPSFGLNSEIELKAEWKFRKLGTKKYYPAEVPGTIHTDLLRNKLIVDPFVGRNETKVQWVENEDWEYSGSFKCDKQTLQNKHIELLFEGLDTYATVSINGKQLLVANNMFRSWKRDVKSFLKPGLNEVKIIFESAVKKGKAEAKKLPYLLPGDEKVFTRKAQYQYGWDWGPRLVTCGVYKPVKLIYWDEVKFEKVKHVIKELNDSIAEVQFITQITSDVDANYTCMINVYKGTVNNAKLQHRKNYNLQLKKGTKTDTLSYTIDYPKLWYTNGLGESQLYGCDLEIRQESNVLDHKKINIGLKKLELVKEKDSFGESFYFKLNGKPIFIKGANYIPQDNFITKTTWDHYHQLIDMSKKANMNMLRVWGGGVYPDDAFYELCDRYGILVWQDLMFACAMYPGDSMFVENVKQEVIEQAERLQNHPSMALWCGNNEVSEGWYNWGWQKQYNYSKQDSAKIWNDYNKLFHIIIPEELNKLGISNYHPSSPSVGWGHPESLTQGDSHYWGVWWGMEPFDIYEKKVGRFMSEYGFQGMPSYFTLKQYGDSLNLNSSYIKAHQKHPAGFQTINTYMEREYKVPKDFFKYVYISQLLQRDGMQTAIEAHRRNKPYCMGTMFWQLNDCWPVTSWSAIDYDYKAKALYYSIKKTFSNFLISVDSTIKGNYQFYVVSDSADECRATLEINLKNTNGQLIFSRQKNILIKENSSEVFEILFDEIRKPFKNNEIYVSCDLILNGRSIAHKNYFFVKPKDLKLLEPELKIELSEDGTSLSVSSKKFIKDLYLYSDNPSLKFEENFFDIEPGQSQTIKLSSGIKFLKEIKHVSLYDINKLP